ncbi:hypothetical protein M011DRAFT_479417 [Sporormia fimetaria CBS 119925]|uniref:Apple domain-containing protein n=1 Tax=Sporormia fimetaria CBS 119925 TaxID=1340428 RepID=A0A6A6V387_9PLEO|nr:hypothetical protein M011DRAFT_479417 [Sporormia fimetaria CBS 119925]
MCFLSKERLVALICASAVFATPLKSEPISTHTLESRQENCPTDYTSQNGLRFTGYCDKCIVGYDVFENGNAVDGKIMSMEDCMERCSRFSGEVGATYSGGCFAIVYALGDGNCWIKNNTVGTSDMIDAPQDSKMHVAFPDRTQL